MLKFDMVVHYGSAHCAAGLVIKAENDWRDS